MKAEKLIYKKYKRATDNNVWRTVRESISVLANHRPKKHIQPILDYFSVQKKLHPLHSLDTVWIRNSYKVLVFIEEVAHYRL